MIESNLDDDTDENEEEALEGLVDDKAIDSSSSVGVGIAGDSFDGLLVSKTDGIIDGTSLDLSVGPALGSVDGFSLVSVLGSDDGAIVGSCVPILLQFIFKWFHRWRFRAPALSFLVHHETTRRHWS